MIDSMLTEIFVKIDDFCQKFEPRWEKSLLESHKKHRRREGQLCLSEKLTIIVCFQISGFRTFKSYYQFLRAYHRPAFPQLVSYNRFVQLMPKTLIPLCAYLLSCRGQVRGISFIDSTLIGGLP